MSKHTYLLRLLLSIFVAHLWFIAGTSAHRVSDLLGDQT